MNNKYKKTVLDNGIRLYVHGDKTMRKCYVSYTVEYGSSGEFFKFNYKGKDYEVLPGCAHFLEHMLLEQSKYGNLYKYFKTIKYQTNAFTAFNRTKFFFSGSKNIKSSIKKLIDALENPIFGDKEIKEVSYAVAEETKRGLNDHFFQGLCLHARNMYKNFDYTHESLNSIGTEETTNALDYKMLRLCYDAFYTDDRKIIVITGPIDEDEIINYVKKIYSKIKNHKNETKLIIPKDLRTVRKREDVLVRKTVEDDTLFVGYNEYLEGFSKFEIDSFITFISLSKFSNKTEWFNRLVKEGSLVTYHGCDYDHIFIDSQFSYSFIFLVRDKDRVLKEFEKEIKINNFTEKDFELYKKGSISNYIYSWDDKYYQYTVLPEQIISNKKEIDYIEEVNKLSFDRFIKFYNSLKFDNRVITLLTKEG